MKISVKYRERSRRKTFCCVLDFNINTMDLRGPRLG